MTFSSDTTRSLRCAFSASSRLISLSRSSAISDRAGEPSWVAVGRPLTSASCGARAWAARYAGDRRAEHPAYGVIVTSTIGRGTWK